MVLDTQPLVDPWGPKENAVSERVGVSWLAETEMQEEILPE